MVANFDPVGQPGTHWVAIYAPNNFHVYYFDSTGGDGVENINDYLKQKFPISTKQHQVLQHPRTEVCGHYAIYYIYMCARKIPFEIVERKLCSMQYPDIYVYHFTTTRIIPKRSRFN